MALLLCLKCPTNFRAAAASLASTLSEKPLLIASCNVWPKQLTPTSSTATDMFAALMNNCYNVIIRYIPFFQYAVQAFFESRSPDLPSSSYYQYNVLCCEIGFGGITHQQHIWPPTSCTTVL